MLRVEGRRVREKFEPRRAFMSQAGGRRESHGPPKARTFWRPKRAGVSIPYSNFSSVAQSG